MPQSHQRRDRRHKPGTAAGRTGTPVGGAGTERASIAAGEITPAPGTTEAGRCRQSEHPKPGARATAPRMTAAAEARRSTERPGRTTQPPGLGATRRSRWARRRASPGQPARRPRLTVTWPTTSAQPSVDKKMIDELATAPSRTPPTCPDRATGGGQTSWPSGRTPGCGHGRAPNTTAAELAARCTGRRRAGGRPPRSMPGPGPDTTRWAPAPPAEAAAALPGGQPALPEGQPPHHHLGTPAGGRYNDDPDRRCSWTGAHRSVVPTSTATAPERSTGPGPRPAEGGGGDTYTRRAPAGHSG